MRRAADAQVEIALHDRRLVAAPPDFEMFRLRPRLPNEYSRRGKIARHHDFQVVRRADLKFRYGRVHNFHPEETVFEVVLVVAQFKEHCVNCPS